MSYNKNSGYGLLEAIRATVQLPVMGKVLFVCPSTDANYERLAQIIDTDSEGVVRLYTTVAAAYEAATTNANDVIVLSGNATHTVTEMLTVAKNRVHFLGMDGGGRISGQGTKIQIGVTGVATDLAPVLVTGVRNTFRNIKFINASTTNQTLYGFIDNGEATFIENCSFAKVAGLDDASHAHFWMAGDSLNMKNCMIGQSNVPNAAAGFGILIDGKTGGATDGTVKENVLENIYVNMSVLTAAKDTSCFIKVADGSALNFGNTINKITCNNFIQNGTGTIMTDAILGAASVAGNLDIVDPVYFGCTGVGSAAGQGINVAARGLAPVAAGGLCTAVTD